MADQTPETISHEAAAADTAPLAASAAGTSPADVTAARPVVSSGPRRISKRALRYLSICAAAVAVALAGLGYYAYAHRISVSSVRAAQQAATTTSSDLDGLSIPMAALSSTTSVKDFNAQVNAINHRLADAQQQYAVLRDSPVQRDRTVRLHFNAFAAKWPSYISFIKNNMQDMQRLGPVLLTFQTDINQLITNPPGTTADWQTYLANAKTVTATATSKLAVLHLQTSDNKQLQTTLQTFVHSTAQAVAQAQQDQAAGKSVSALTQDLQPIVDAERTFISARSAFQGNLVDRVGRTDPGTAFQAVQTALNTLHARLVR